MFHDDRFGLAMSLAEALEADPSPAAAALAALISEQGRRARPLGPNTTGYVSRDRDHVPQP